jgi:hypothetical protein
VIEGVFDIPRNGTGREALRSRERSVPLRAGALPSCRERQRRLPTEARVRARGIVQSEEITPTRSKNRRFSSGGIRGSGGLFMSMR